MENKYKTKWYEDWIVYTALILLATIGMAMFTVGVAELIIMI